MPLIFLIVDFHTENRQLLARTLQRKYPDATILECDGATEACDIVGRGVSAVIIHRTFDTSAPELITQLREINASIPYIVVSSIDRRDDVIKAGARTFLLYDEWLRLGTVVEECLHG
jgi:DNA-binding NarL/FixJ family response regulator